MNKIKKFLKDFFRLTSAKELKEAVQNSDYQRVACILRWHRSLVNHIFSFDTLYDEYGSYDLKHYKTVLDLVSINDTDMVRLLQYFGGKPYREIEDEKAKKEKQKRALLLQADQQRAQIEALQREEEYEQQKWRRQNGKAIVDRILGTN